MSTHFTVKRAETREDKQLVYRLRYQVFVDELHYQIPNLNSEIGLVEPEDESAFLFLVYDGARAVGTLAIDWWKHTEIKPHIVESFQLHHFITHFPKDAICLVRKALVIQAYRNTLAFATLVQIAIKDILKQSEIRFGFMDCSPYLVKHYERLGCRRYAPAFVYDDTGIISVPMCLVLDDQLYLEQVAPFLLSIIRRLGRKDDPSVRKYFVKYWKYETEIDAIDPHALPVLDPLIKDAPNIYHRLADIPLFLEMAHHDILDLVSASEKIKFKAGDRLLAQGQSERHVYLLLDGYVEVAIDKKSKRVAIATLGEGDILGEMSLLLDRPRTADVQALTEGEALYISEDVIDKMVENRPEMATQFYKNLARILADRLRKSSLWITERPPL